MTTDESERIKIKMLASKIKQLSLALVHEVRTKFDHPEISQELCQKKTDKFTEHISRNIEELNKVINSPTRKSEIDGGKSIMCESLQWLYTILCYFILNGFECLKQHIKCSFVIIYLISRDYWEPCKNYFKLKTFSSRRKISKKWCNVRIWSLTNLHSLNVNSYILFIS